MFRDKKNCLESMFRDHRNCLESMFRWLPMEVIYRILGYLKTRDLREMSRTCWHMYRVVDGADQVWNKQMWQEFGVCLQDL